MYTSSDCSGTACHNTKLKVVELSERKKKKRTEHIMTC